MPDLKISQLIDGGLTQATDEFVVARAGTNNKITGANLATAATATINPSATQSGSALVNQADIGSAPNEIPLNQYLGTMAYQDAAAIDVGIVVHAAGSATVPSLTATGDTNTGLFYPAADTVAVTTGGSERIRVNSAGQLAMNANGTEAAPIITRVGDENTGLYYPGADQVALAAGGKTSVMAIANNGVAFGQGYNLVYSAALPGNVTATTGTIVFSFACGFPGTVKAGVVKILFLGNSASNTPSNSPACEYIAQVHRTTASVVTFNGATTIFEYTFVRATHLAFADTGSSTFTLTLTNPTGQTLFGSVSSYRVELLSSAYTLTGVTVT